MYSKTLKTPFAALLGAGLCVLPACQDASVDAPGVNVDGASVMVKLTRFDSSPSVSTTSVELFHCAGGVLKEKLTTTVPQDNPVLFTRENDNKVYALSGYSVEAAEGCAENEIARAVISLPGDVQSAPIFFSAVASLDSVSNSLSISMIRGVARIDINNIDPLLKVSGVTVENVAPASYVFPVEGEKYAGEGTLSWSRSYADGIEGLEKGSFTLFESENPVNVTITGEKDGEAISIEVATPAINRNKVYTVVLDAESSTPDEPGDNPAKVNATVVMTDWEAGDSYYPGPDTTHGLTLDVEACSFPANVTYDPVSGYVEVPAEGIDDLHLAFRSDLRIDIDGILLEGDFVERDSLQNHAVTVKGYTMQESGNDVITTYSLKIVPQLVCRPEYTIDLGIRKASMANVYDHVKIRVAPHPKQIETVKMAGIEWMCFNATSTKLEEQILLADGASVEDMYNAHFADCIGNYFQYGKENPFSPWTSNDPAQFADQTRDIPWKTPGRMPLPEGYHVASAAEWKALMPNGITLPAAWMTEAGDSIKGSVVTLDGTLQTPSEAVNAKNFKMRYVLFESVTTGNKLYVPFGGIKSNNNAEVPGQGKLGVELRTAYWVAEDRYIWLIDYKATADKLDGAVLKQDRWGYDGFVLVRGVKD